MNNTETWVNELSRRELNFIAYSLSLYGYPLVLPANRELIIINIKDMNNREHNKIDDMENLCKSRMVDESLFDWLQNDTRALLWMHKFYNNQFPPSNIPKNYTQASPNLFENFVYNIDSSYHQVSLPVFTSTSLSPTPFGNPLPQYNNTVIDFNFALKEKIEYLNLARNRYVEIKTDRKNTNWIDKNNEDQLYWAIDYLKNNNLLIIVSNFVAYTKDDLHDNICASLDFIDANVSPTYPYLYSPSAQKQLVISKMRKAWSQKKFRDKKDIESAQELLLTSEYKNKLNKLANLYNVDPVKYLKDLIDNEAAQL